MSQYFSPLDIILKDVVLYLLYNRFVPAVKIMPAPLDSVWNVGSGSAKPALKHIKGSNSPRTIKYAKKRKYLLVCGVDLIHFHFQLLRFARQLRYECFHYARRCFGLVVLLEFGCFTNGVEHLFCTFSRLSRSTVAMATGRVLSEWLARPALFSLELTHLVSLFSIEFGKGHMRTYGSHRLRE